MIRTKILATVGPASSDSETLLRLMEAGADVFRLNFSHGTLDAHGQSLANIRSSAEKFGRAVAVLGDLCGPKIRLGPVRDIQNGGVPIDVGQDLVIQRQPIECDESRRASCTWPAIIDDIKTGDRVLIEDGLLRFVCTETAADEIRLRCTAGGTLKSAKGINLPSTDLRLDPITPRDWECVNWAIESGLDYVALSFVRRADDLQALRKHMRDRGNDAQLIAKIEKPEAVSQIDSIIDAADGLMVARGDLGVEMDVAQVPLIQKDIVRRCNAAAKPVIVATQMLQSMIEASSPTRAEVSDVANAIFDGTDAVMLSGETSVGKHPIAAVHIMSHICQTTEAFLDASPADIVATIQSHALGKTTQLSAGVARGVRQMADAIDLKLVVIFSQTGSTVRLFSKLRFPVPIIALSSDGAVMRRCALHYGVYPLTMELPADIDQLVRTSEKLLLDRKLASAGDRVAIISGTSLGAPGTINGVVLHTLGETI